MESHYPKLPPGTRNRAVRLLETFFAHDGERERRTIFNAAFAETQPNPSRHIEFIGGVADFAAHAVDQLLAFGCVGRGRHAHSMLLATMADIRGRRTDYYDLQWLLDGD